MTKEYYNKLKEQAAENVKNDEEYARTGKFFDERAKIELDRLLWKEAQQNARKNFSDVYDVDEWEDLDKYQREDCVFSEFDILRKECEAFEQETSKEKGTER